MLDSLFTRIRDRERRLTVYRSGDEADLEERFAVHNVRLDSRKLPPGGPDPFLVIEKDGEFAGALGLRELEWLLEPPIARPGERDGVSEGYRLLFEMLDDTVFIAMERRQLLAVSREIEDRAYRVGTGALRVSFQTLSTFRSQADVYRYLAADTGLDIHVHGLADWTPPEIAGISYHGHANGSIGQYWALAFDGGDDETQTCGLVAREQTDEYSGFWTDDAGIVTEIASELARA